MEEMKSLKNGKIVELARIYRKVSGIEMDFEKIDEMMKLVEDSISVESSLKVYSKLEEKIRDDSRKNLEGASQEKALEIEQDFVKKINALSEKETTLEKPLNKLNIDIAKEAKLTVGEFRTLKELDLI